MPLVLYRRHRRDCKAGHAEDLRTSEYDERKKGWRRCECPILVSGTLAGKFKRQNTGEWEWDAARPVSAVWETLGAWDGPQPKLPEPCAPAPTELPAPRITVEQAIAAFMAEIESHAATNTLKKYALLLKKLRKYSESQGYTAVTQWTPSDVREMRNSWQVSPQTAGKDMSTVKAFFEFCLANEWIDRNPARLIKNQRTRDAAERRFEPKLPFTDEELERMYHTCQHLYGKQLVNRKSDEPGKPLVTDINRYRWKWTGDDLADFISVSVYTGLRISDVVTFHVDRLQSDGSIRLRTTKAGTHVYTWVPQWLQDRIRQRAETVGPLIFGEHTTNDLNVITDVWRRKLIKLWSLCGPWKEKPTPHRFRHTFARILLQRTNVTVRDVAELLGNTEQMVLKHYSAWVTSRQERLTNILKEAFDDKPMPMLVRNKRGA